MILKRLTTGVRQAVSDFRFLNALNIRAEFWSVKNFSCDENVKLWSKKTVKHESQRKSALRVFQHALGQVLIYNICYI